jgi:cytochrome c biogenesis protein CcdA/glutaredoxin
VEGNATRKERVEVHMFTRDDCGFCKAEKEFFDKLTLKRDDFFVTYHNLSSPESRTLFIRLTDTLSLPKVTPITIVRYSILQGFDSPEGAGLRIEKAISQEEGKKVVTIEEVLLGKDLSIDSSEGGCVGDTCGITRPEGEFIFKLPFVGVVNLQDFSLFTLALMLGTIDGFNPCAMWVLITFLLVLMQIGSRKKMFQVAGIFIISEAIMYTVILNVWYKTWDFVGLDRIITPLVGVVALGGGCFFLYRFKKQRKGALVCDITNIDQQSKIESKIKSFASSRFTFLSMLGIMGLAFSVNIIEFACSIGIPQAFTKIIELNNLSFFKTQWYMFLYTLGYMIDDFIVFGLALLGIQKLSHLGQKYSTLSLLIGGVLMIILGMIMILNPGILVF